MHHFICAQIQMQLHLAINLRTNIAAAQSIIYHSAHHFSYHCAVISVITHHLIQLNISASISCSARKYNSITEQNPFLQRSNSTTHTSLQLTLRALFSARKSNASTSCAAKYKRRIILEHTFSCARIYLWSTVLLSINW